MPFSRQQCRPRNDERQTIERDIDAEPSRFQGMLREERAEGKSKEIVGKSRFGSTIGQTFVGRFVQNMYGRTHRVRISRVRALARLYFVLQGIKRVSCL